MAFSKQLMISYEQVNGYMTVLIHVSYYNKNTINWVASKPKPLISHSSRDSKTQQVLCLQFHMQKGRGRAALLGLLRKCTNPTHALRS